MLYKHNLTFVQICSLFFQPNSHTYMQIWNKILSNTLLHQIQVEHHLKREIEVQSHLESHLMSGVSDIFWGIWNILLVHFFLQFSESFRTSVVVDVFEVVMTTQSHLLQSEWSVFISSKRLVSSWCSSLQVYMFVSLMWNI